MRGLAAVGCVLMAAGAAAQQQFGDLQGAGERPTAKGPQYLSYVAEPATVMAGKRAMVEVHLRVAEGFHVNSHRPASDLLIPTTVVVKAADAGVTVGEVAYPAGVRYSFKADPAEALDVYTGSVVVRVPVTASKGEHVLTGTLRYQACDDRSCFPPKTVPLEVPFTAR